MTIDERIERLTERHEALTPIVESIAAAQLKTDERMAVISDRMVQLMETMTRLGNIFAHEERLERLEDRS